MAVKYVYNVSARWTVKTDKFTLFVYCNFLVLQSTTECSQHKQTKCVHIRRNSYRLQLSQWVSLYTKSKNYLKRRYQICHSIPMFIKTPCRNKSLKITELCLALMLMASKIHRFDFVPHASATATAWLGSRAT